MNRASPFVGLLLTGGKVACRRPECFYEIEHRVTSRRARVLRFLVKEESYGKQCAACKRDLAPRPAWLKA